MRTKSRGSLSTAIAPGTIAQFRASNNGLYAGPVAINNVKNSGEIHVISYDDSKRNNSQPKTTRWCDHYTVTAEGRQIREVFYLHPGTYYADANHYLMSPDINPVDIPDVSSLHTEAMQFFKAGCQNQEIDLALNFLELNQVKSLIPNLKRTFLALRNHLAIKSVKWTLKNAADLHLAYSFGIAPLVSDVSSIVSSIRGLNDKISWLRKNSGKKVRVDFRKDLSSQNRPGNTVLTSNINEKCENYVRQYRASYHAFATITYDVSQLCTMELALRNLVRQFGLDKPLSTLWNHLPWSFVIDWVFNVGQVLDSFQPSITLPTRFHDLGYSVKVYREDELRLERFFPKSGSCNNSVKRIRTRYVRFPGLPVSFATLAADSDISLRQLALSMSLSLQKWR